MLKRNSLRFLAVLTLMGAAACGSEDRPVGGADPAGMGAGRPDTTGPGQSEVPAPEVLDGMDVMPMGTQQDTSDTSSAPGQSPRPRQ